MRKKQILKIAGMEISVVTDADSAIVEQSVGMVDRTIREIKLKSNGCSLTEAAILCALDSNAERLTQQQKYASYETQIEQDKETIEDLTRRVNALTATVASLQEKLDQTAAEPGAEPVAAEESAPEQPVAAEQPEAAEEVAADTEPAPEPAPQPKAQTRTQRPKSKSHVGSMFDLLTFDDV
ncbi:MAG: cell division protein ZapA [Clostridia bacterium]|nr:cell division protein ZapA [Clostridia bacterium]